MLVPVISIQARPGSNPQAATIPVPGAANISK
jgi:hypothetical protein